MLDTPLSTELNELMDRAHEGSDRIGYSDAGVSAYTAATWMKDFRRHYHVRKFNLIPAEETFEESLAEWYGCTAPALAQALKDRLGEPLEVLRAEDHYALTDQLSSCNGRIGAYYCTDDAFFVVFRTHALAFIMGSFD
jgi:hypothetical protein